MKIGTMQGRCSVIVWDTRYTLMDMLYSYSKQSVFVPNFPSYLTYHLTTLPYPPYHSYLTTLPPLPPYLPPDNLLSIPYLIPRTQRIRPTSDEALNSLRYFTFGFIKRFVSYILYCCVLGMLSYVYNNSCSGGHFTSLHFTSLYLSSAHLASHHLTSP